MTEVHRPAQRSGEMPEHDAHLESAEMLEKAKDAAVLRLFDTAAFHALNFEAIEDNRYRYISEALWLVAQSRGLHVRVASPDNALEADQTLLIPPQPLTPDELNLATEAIWDHDEMGPEERREVKMPLSDEGIPVQADVEACLEFIDDLDPESNFSFDSQEVTECTWSCKCLQGNPPRINPVDRRSVLTRWNKKRQIMEDYDPPGTSPRVAVLRNAWRAEQRGIRMRYREYGVKTEHALRSTPMPEALDVGVKQNVDWDVNPLYVEVVRDETRAVVEGEGARVVDPKLRPALEKEYIHTANLAAIEAGYHPLTPDQVLDHTKRTRLEPLVRKPFWEKAFSRFTGSGPDIAALEARDAAREDVKRALTEQYGPDLPELPHVTPPEPEQESPQAADNAAQRNLPEVTRRPAPPHPTISRFDSMSIGELEGAGPRFDHLRENDLDDIGRMLEERDEPTVTNHRTIAERREGTKQSDQGEPPTNRKVK